MIKTADIIFITRHQKIQMSTCPHINRKRVCVVSILCFVLLKLWYPSLKVVIINKQETWNKK